MDITLKCIPMISMGEVNVPNRCVLHYKPIIGAGVTGHANLPKISEISLFGYSIKDETLYTLIDKALLKDFAATGFTGYKTTTAIPSGNETGNETALIINIDSPKICEFVYAKIWESQCLEDIYGIDLILRGQSAIPVPILNSPAIDNTPSQTNQLIEVTTSPAISDLIDSDFKLIDDATGDEISISSSSPAIASTYELDCGAELRSGDSYTLYLAKEKYNFGDPLTFTAGV